MANDIIAAVATAPGRGGVGVIRISGPTLRDFAEALLGRLPPPRFALYGDFKAADGAVLDNGLALYFAGPKSFTGEDVLELQGHGGPVVLNLVLRRCLELGARLAEPGEFSRRAFLNGKLDLAQAESIADLIDAGSETAARSAIRSLQGVFSKEIHALTDGLIHLRMLVEATLDFPEEEIDFLEAADAMGQLQRLHAQLQRVQASARQGSLLREGMHVVLIGQPNVGKSSLLNCLAGQEVAIVTEIAGTTRDTVRELIELDGVPVHVIDTAGLRDTDDTVEKLGIERTWAAIEKADLALLLIDSRHGIGEQEARILDRLPLGLPLLQVFNKIDLSHDAPGLGERDGRKTVFVSAKQSLGLDVLKAQLLDAVGWQGESEGLFIARERHLDALRRAAGHLQRAEDNYPAIELIAEELRLGQDSLNEITGEFTSDDLLGVIFSRFCIGK